MALPHHHFHQTYQPPQTQSTSFRNPYAIDGQICPAVAYFDPNALQAHSHHPPYVPPFHVVGFAPGPVAAAADDSGNGGDFQLNYGKESKRRRLKEQDFMENNNNNNNNNNSQVSSVLQKQKSVSTGLGLSLDNNRRASSTGESDLLSLIGEDVDLELQRQDSEIDRFLKAQNDRLRKNILDKVQAAQPQTLSVVEEKVLQKLREKDAEVASINKKNMELEKRMDQLDLEARIWQHQASNNEHMIAALKDNLDQVIAQSRDSKEGCGDSEVDDTASCCNGRPISFNMFGKENNVVKEVMMCKACRTSEVCMLLLPCKHLCLCKDCESKLSVCPVCQSSKFIGMEVFY